MSATRRVDPPHSVRGLGAAVRSATLSIIIPAKNESASLPGMMREIATAFRPLMQPGRSGGNPLFAYEVVVVDDGSTDDSSEVLKRLQGEYPELRPVVLARHAGQSAATLCGFRHAQGDWVAILDADLQNPPAELARLWDAMPGYDAGLGWRLKRQDVTWKKHLSKVANRVRNWVLGDTVKDTGCAVRIFPRDVALRFPMFHGAHRFYGAMLLREGCKIVQIPVEHRARPHGKSHYNFWNRSLNVMFDLMGMAWLMRRPVRYEVGWSAQLPRPTAHVGRLLQAGEVGLAAGVERTTSQRGPGA